MMAKTCRAPLGCTCQVANEVGAQSAHVRSHAKRVLCLFGFSVEQMYLRIAETTWPGEEIETTWEGRHHVWRI